MRLTEPPLAAERQPQFAEMATWHEWPEGPDNGGRWKTLRPNIGVHERWGSLLGGGALAAFGLSRRSLPGGALAAAGAYLVYRGVSGYCPMYAALGINAARDGRAEPADFFDRGIHVAQTITINRPPEALYSFWRDLTNLPRVMSHLKSVSIIDERRSRWVAKGPMNSDIEWDAEIINDEPNDTIAWRSLDDAEVHNAGSVRFVRAPGNRGTEVRVTVEYIPAAGKLGAAIAKIFGEEPNQQIKEDLRRFKQVMETGEVPTTEGSRAAGARHEP